MYVIPVMPRLCAAPPDNGPLFHLVLNLLVLLGGGLVLLLYSSVSSVCQEKKIDREKERVKVEEDYLEIQPISHPEVVAVCDVNL